jgi:hypothetical protein
VLLRAKAKRATTRPAVAAIAADAVLLSSDLRVWAGERVAAAGHESALLGKVEALRLAADGRSVEGKVRDQGPTPYRVAVSVDGHGLESRCECPYEGGPVCKHAVAILEALRFPRPAVIHVAGSQKRARRAGRLARGQGRDPRADQRGPPLGQWALTRDEVSSRARTSSRGSARKEKPTITRVARRLGLPRFRVQDRTLVPTRGAPQLRRRRVARVPI